MSEENEIIDAADADGHPSPRTFPLGSTLEFIGYNNDAKRAFADAAACGGLGSERRSKRADQVHPRACFGLFCVVMLAGGGERVQKDIHT